MPRKLIEATYYLLLSIPIIYIGMLFVYASSYQDYYGGLTQVPFDFSAVVVEGLLSLAALITVYIIAAQQKRLLQAQYQGVDKDRQAIQSRIVELQKQLTTCQDELMRVDQAQQEQQSLLQNHSTLMAKFLVTQKLETIFNSDLFRDLQAEGPIEDGAEKRVKKLTGGYSGAQVYSFYRRGNNIPSILKMPELEEIKNESQKFKDHVKGKLLIGPKLCRDYAWGSYGGLEYNLNWSVAGCDHLTFLQIYKECLYENVNPPVGINTIQRIIERLFKELQQPENWWRPDLVRVPPPVNIYQEHYPFTKKLPEIDPLVRSRFAWGQAILNMSDSSWQQYERAVDTLLSIRVWNSRTGDHRYLFNIVRASIHGDLNARNILLEANYQDHNDIHTLGLVDFSHAGNGLTQKRIYWAIQAGVQFDTDQGHITTDFCRLEADIKFYLTDLNDEQELRQAWIVENLLLEHKLQLPDWLELQQSNAFGQFLQAQGLSNELGWEKLNDPYCWSEDKARKFILIWQSVKTIRNALSEILIKKLPQSGPLPMPPFYLALLQTTLGMIYYENERFHNADLQKLYLVLASALLCQKLL